MHRLVLIGALVVVAECWGRGPLVRTAVTRSPEIVVAEFAQAGALECPDRTSRLCKRRVRVRILRVLKDAVGLGAPPEPFELDIPVYSGDSQGDEGNIWTDLDLRDGAQYLLIAGGHPATFAGVVGSALTLEPVTPEADPTADVQSILGISDLSAVQQAQTLAGSIMSAQSPHGRLLTQYVAELLRIGNPGETSSLAQALESAPENAFSDEGRAALLGGLRDAAIEARRQELDRLLFSLTARYFLIDPDPHPKPSNRLVGADKLSLTQSEILANIVPWMVNQKLGQTFSTSLPTPLRQRLEAKLALLLSDPQVWYRDQMSQFTTLMGDH